MHKLRHNTQKVPATLPSVSHARSDSFVAACRRATAGEAGTDTEEEGGEGRGGGAAEVALSPCFGRRRVSHRGLVFYDSDEYIFVA